MKTNDLVSMLANGAGAVDQKALARRYFFRRWLRDHRRDSADGRVVRHTPDTFARYKPANALDQGGVLHRARRRRSARGHPPRTARYAARLGTRGACRAGRHDVDPRSHGVDWGKCGESNRIDLRAYIDGLPICHRAAINPGVHRPSMVHEEPRPDTPPAGWRRLRPCIRGDRGIGVHIALSRTRATVSRYLVCARHADTDRRRRLARSSPIALVGPGTPNRGDRAAPMRMREPARPRGRLPTGTTPASVPRRSLIAFAFHIREQVF